MKRTLTALLLLPTPLLAQGILEGMWKEDVTTEKYVGPPTTVVLTNETYQCKSCVPPYAVPADGKPHAIAGHPFYDAFAIRIVDGHTVHDSGFRGGTDVFDDDITISVDGRTLMDAYTQAAANNTAPITATLMSTRIAAGPAGTHPYSGSWQTTSTRNVSSNGATVVMTQRGSTFSESSMTGQSYTATLGGPPGPAIGNPNITSVAIRQTGPHVFEETGWLKGQIVSIVTLTVSPDGRSMNVVYDDKRYGGVTSWTQTKQ